MTIPVDARRRRVKRPTKVTPARWVAWQTVRRTFDDASYADRVFATEAERQQLDARDRAFAQHLAYGTVQEARRLDHIIAVVGKRPLRKIDAHVLHALRVGMFELVGPADDDRTPRAQHAAVSQAVELVRGVVGERAVAFTNAVLRRAQVDAASIVARLDPTDDDDLATMLSLPVWMITQMRDAFGQDGIDALAAQNSPTSSSTSVRINTLHPNADNVDAALHDAGVILATDAPYASRLGLSELRLLAGAMGAIGTLVDDGMLLPQSAASMLVAYALAPQPGERVLDMCAAPGGKTTHLAALMQGRGTIVACELHEHRAESIRALARTLRADSVVSDVRVADATTLDVREVGQFDRVLVDAPCSGLGVLSRRPDARWRRHESDLEQLVGLQQQLLRTAATLVRPGGIVVYSTCTMLPSENEQVVEACADVLDADPLPASIARELILPHAQNMARTWPHRHQLDGFFFARLRRPGGDAT